MTSRIILSIVILSLVLYLHLKVNNKLLTTRSLTTDLSEEKKK